MTKITDSKESLTRTGDRLWYIVPFLFFGGIISVFVGYFLKLQTLTLIGLTSAMLAYVVFGIILQIAKTLEKQKNQKP